MMYRHTEDNYRKKASSEKVWRVGQPVPPSPVASPLAKLAQSHHGAALDEDGFVQVSGRSIAKHTSKGN